VTPKLARVRWLGRLTMLPIAFAVQARLL
jgi:hypothetical protein